MEKGSDVTHLQQAAIVRRKLINIMDGLANESLTYMLLQSFYHKSTFTNTK